MVSKMASSISGGEKSCGWPASMTRSSVVPERGAPSTNAMGILSFCSSMEAPSRQCCRKRPSGGGTGAILASDGDGGEEGGGKLPRGCRPCSMVGRSGEAGGDRREAGGHRKKLGGPLRKAGGDRRKA